MRLRARFDAASRLSNLTHSASGTTTAAKRACFGINVLDLGQHPGLDHGRRIPEASIARHHSATSAACWLSSHAAPSSSSTVVAKSVTLARSKSGCEVSGETATAPAAHPFRLQRDQLYRSDVVNVRDDEHRRISVTKLWASAAPRRSDPGTRGHRAGRSWSMCWCPLSAPGAVLRRGSSRRLPAGS